MDNKEFFEAVRSLLEQKHFIELGTKEPKKAGENCGLFLTDGTFVFEYYKEVNPSKGSELWITHNWDVIKTVAQIVSFLEKQGVTVETNGLYLLPDCKDDYVPFDWDNPEEVADLFDWVSYISKSDSRYKDFTYLCDKDYIKKQLDKAGFHLRANENYFSVRNNDGCTPIKEDGGFWNIMDFAKYNIDVLSDGKDADPLTKGVYKPFDWSNEETLAHLFNYIERFTNFNRKEGYCYIIDGDRLSKQLEAVGLCLYTNGTDYIFCNIDGCASLKHSIDFLTTTPLIEIYHKNVELNFPTIKQEGVVQCLDEGHTYAITPALRTANNVLEFADETIVINFLKGSIDSEYRKGIVIEQLLAVLLDKFKFYQNKQVDVYNTQIVEHLEACLKLMEDRVYDRIERGVLGKNVK